MPSFSSDATLPQPSFASPNPAAESTASFTPWRSVTSLKTSRDPSVPASSVSSTQGALQLKEGSTEPDPLYARCGGHMAVHRGSWPQTASSKQTMSVQMPRRTVGPASDATGSCTSAPANVMCLSNMAAAVSRNQEQLPVCYPATYSNAADVSVLRLGGLKSCTGSGVLSLCSITVNLSIHHGSTVLAAYWGRHLHGPICHVVGTCPWCPVWPTRLLCDVVC